MGGRWEVASHKPQTTKVLGARDASRAKIANANRADRVFLTGLVPIEPIHPNPWQKRRLGQLASILYSAKHGNHGRHFRRGNEHERAAPPASKAHSTRFPQETSAPSASNRRTPSTSKSAAKRTPPAATTNTDNVHMVDDGRDSENACRLRDIVGEGTSSYEDSHTPNDWPESHRPLRLQCSLLFAIDEPYRI